MPRLNTIKGIWANSATTTIPVPPVDGTAYRDTTLTAATIQTGFEYNNPLNSSDFNQALYEVYGLLQDVEQRGAALYSELTDYSVGALCTRDDGATMKAIVANGPATTLKDPNTAGNIPGSWVIMHGARPGLVEPIPEATTARIFSLNDCGQIIRTENAAATAITIPTNAAVAIPIGTIIIVRQAGAGLVTTTADGGVTVNGVVAGAIVHEGQYKDVMFHKVATDTWDAIGAIA